MDDDFIDDDWSDDEDGWEPDDSESDDEYTIDCQNCGREFYEDAEMCPYCGEFVMRNSSVLGGKPGWYVLLAIIGIVAVILALSGISVWL